MTAFSNIFEIALLNHIFHPDVYFYPMTAMLVALWIGAPTDTGLGGAEVSGGGYGRLVTVPSGWTWAAYGSIANDVPFIFPVATAPWGTVGNPISHFALFNTGGYMLFHGPLTEPMVVEAGLAAMFAKWSLVVALD